jgi:mannose-6-phosphate isomerase-like protein (cupin superfamily)
MRRPEQSAGSSSEAISGRAVLPLDDLPHTDHAHEFVGAEYGDVPFSVILVHSAPGVGPRLHRHPYAEVFIVESGQATFQLGDEEIVVEGGHVVVGAPGVPHGFINTGTGELRLVAIHGASRFATEWLKGRDPVWASQPRRNVDRAP